MLAAALRSASRLSGSHATTRGLPYDLNAAAAASSRYFGSARDATKNTVSYNKDEAAGVSGRDALSAAKDALNGANTKIDIRDELDAKEPFFDGGSSKRSSSSAIGGVTDDITASSASRLHSERQAWADAVEDNSKKFDGDLISKLNKLKELPFFRGSDASLSSSSSSSSSSDSVSTLDSAANVSYFGGASDTTTSSSAVAAPAIARRENDFITQESEAVGQPRFRPSFPNDRRGKTLLLIPAEEEARERQRRQALLEVEDPSTEGLRLAFLAMKARERELYDRYLDAGCSERDPNVRDLENRQRDSEIKSVELEVARYVEESEKTADRGEGPRLPLGRRLLQGFYGPLLKAMHAEMEQIINRVQSKDRKTYGPCFLMLQPEKLAVITLHVVISELMKGGQGVDKDSIQAGTAKYVAVVQRLGEAVQAEVILGRMKARARQQKSAETELREEAQGVRDLAEDVADVDEFIAKPHVHGRYVQISSKELKTLKGPRAAGRLARMALDADDWGQDMCTKLGAKLLSMLIDTARIRIPGPLRSAAAEEGPGDWAGAVEAASGTEREAAADDDRDRGGYPDEKDGNDEEPEFIEVPAFYHNYMFRGKLRIGTVSWHEAFHEFMDDEYMMRATLQPVRYMPMVTPPRQEHDAPAHLFIRSALLNQSPSIICFSSRHTADLSAIAHRPSPVAHQLSPRHPGVTTTSEIKP